MVYTIRFANAVRRELLASGTLGIDQSRLQQRTRSPNHNTADIRMLLEAWRKRGWVDKYEVHVRGPTKTMWRATQRLQDEWHVVGHLIHEVITGDLPPSVLSLSPSETVDRVKTAPRPRVYQSRRPRSS